MANESYEKFAATLQKEYEQDEGIRFGILESHSFANIPIHQSDGSTAYLGVEKSEQICHDGPLQRRGCEDPVQHAGPLQRRVYARHLYAHHQRYAKGRGGENRRLHGNGHSQAGAGASRPAGGEPMQGDTVRDGGVTKKEGLFQPLLLMIT